MIHATRFVKCLLSALCLWWCGGVLLVAQAAGEAPIIVVYPDTASSFRGVVDQLLQGIQANTKHPVVRLATPEHGEASEVLRVLAQYKTGVVMGLGARGIEVVRQANTGLPTVFGGVVFPELPANGKGAHGSALAMEPDPNLFFDRVRRWAPGIRRVVVIWHVDTPVWFMQRAKEAARQHALELAPLMVADLATGTREYRNTLATLNPDTEALWMTQDARVTDDRGVLMVLQAAWERKLVVMVANLSHVKRGASFGLLPHYLRMGRSLALLAEARLDAPHEPDNGVALKDVVIAVNLRTAAHLGIDRYVRQQAGYDMVFPAP